MALASSVRNANPSEILLVLLRAALAGDQLSVLQRLALSEIDWRSVLDAAERHGVRPLLYRGLTRSPGVVEAVPVLDELRTMCRRIAQHNLLLASKLIEVLGALDRAAIPAFTFKGPVLAESAYGSLSLREFVDLDVMVHRKDMARARDGLRALGYTSRHRLNRSQEDIIMRLNGEYDLISEDRKVALDLHWAFASRYFPVQHEPRDVWEGLVRVPMGGATVRSLPPLDLLIVLCLNGSKSGWVQLKMTHDVAQATHLLSRAEWDEVVSRAHAWGAERCLMLGLALAEDLLGTWLPEPISAAIARDPAVAGLAPRVVSWMVSAPGQSRTRAEEARVYAELSPVAASRLRMWAGLVVTPTLEDAEHLRLARSLSFLYYLFRPFRLLLKYFNYQKRWRPGPRSPAEGG